MPISAAPLDSSPWPPPSLPTPSAPTALSVISPSSPANDSPSGITSRPSPPLAPPSLMCQLDPRIPARCQLDLPAPLRPWCQPRSRRNSRPRIPELHRHLRIRWPILPGLPVDYPAHRPQRLRRHYPRSPRHLRHLRPLHHRHRHRRLLQHPPPAAHPRAHHPPPPPDPTPTPQKEKYLPGLKTFVRANNSLYAL